VQRVVYAENETDDCPRCQTGGKVVAGCSLSRLFRDDRPRSAGELNREGWRA
jgi:formamidopyrimidine-DNA glycosylase